MDFQPHCFDQNIIGLFKLCIGLSTPYIFPTHNEFNMFFFPSQFLQKWGFKLINAESHSCTCLLSSLLGAYKATCVLLLSCTAGASGPVIVIRKQPGSTVERRVLNCWRLTKAWELNTHLDQFELLAGVGSVTQLKHRKHEYSFYHLTEWAAYSLPPNFSTAYLLNIRGTNSE